MNTQSISPVRVNRDGSPDKRFKANKNPNPGTANTQEVQKEAPEYSYKIVNATVLEFYRKGTRIGVVEIGVQPSNISCGVRQIHGVSALQNAMTIGVPREVVISAMTEFIATTKGINRAAYLIASNNMRASNSNNIMDELAINKTDWKKNPRSGNNIKIWIL